MPPKFLDWRALRRPYPQNLTIDIHSFCNAKCRICPYPNIKDQLSMGYMDEALFRRIIDEFAELNRQHEDVRGHVIFCNMGEMFMDKNVQQKINYVMESGLEMIIQTNGSLLTPQRAELLLESGYKGPVYVSFHGITKEVYEGIMGLDYDKSLANVLHMAGLPLNLQIRAYAHKWPRGEAKKVSRFWEDHGMGLRYGFHAPNARTGLVEDLRRSTFKYPGKWLRGCKKGLPLRDMIISWDGKAVLCCEDMGRKVILGDVSQSSIVDVWNSARAEKTMDYLWGGAYGKSDDFICRTCEFGQSNQFRRLVKNVDNSWRMFREIYL